MGFVHVGSRHVRFVLESDHHTRRREMAATAAVQGVERDTGAQPDIS